MRWNGVSRSASRRSHSSPFAGRSRRRCGGHDDARETGHAMSQKYEKLKTLLKELFQLDQPDLDFGLYRIMHAKSAEVSQFLDKDLLPQVKAAFGAYKSADKA